MPEPHAKAPLVCDTSVLLYLGRIGHADLLPALFGPVYIPRAVALELDMGRLLRSDTLNPYSMEWATIVQVPEAALKALPPTA
jgi:predicted nucleic acid-binding protein